MSIGRAFSRWKARRILRANRICFKHGVALQQDTESPDMDGNFEYGIWFCPTCREDWEYWNTYRQEMKVAWAKRILGLEE